MDTSYLSHDIDEYLSDHRPELYEFAETLIRYDTQNPLGRTIDIVEWIESTSSTRWQTDW